MKIRIYSGLTGAGKSLRLAKEALFVLHRNKKYMAKTGIRRLVKSRMKFSPAVEKMYGLADDSKDGLISYWNDMIELIDFRDCDVFWDEMQVDLDSTQWEKTPLEVKRYLQMHRKHGVAIYGTAQDFSTIYIGVRRLTHQLFIMRKAFGSPDKSATRPHVKNPWGLILMHRVLRDDFGKEKEEYRYDGFPELLLIRKRWCHAYDTQQEIFPAEYPPLRHVVRRCSDQDCDFEKLIHI